MGSFPTGSFQKVHIIIDANTLIRVFFHSRYSLKVPPISIEKSYTCCSVGMPHSQRQKLLNKSQVFYSTKACYTVFGVLVCQFIEIRRIKEDQIGFLFSLYRPLKAFRIPLKRFDFRPCFRAIHQIKGPASSMKRQTGIRDNDATGHLPAIALAQARRADRIKNKVSLACKIKKAIWNPSGPDSLLADSI